MTSSSTRPPARRAHRRLGIRRAAVTRAIPCLTTLAAGVSAARAISSAPPRRCARGPVPAGAPWRHAAGRGIGEPPPERRGAEHRALRSSPAQASPASKSSAPTASCASRTRGSAGDRPRTVRDARRRGALGREEDKRPYLPRAFSFAASAAPARPAPARGRRARHPAAVPADPRRSALGVGPLGRGLIVPARGTARDPRRRRRRDRAAGDPQDELCGATTAHRSARLSRPRARRGRRLLPDARVATDDGSVGYDGHEIELLAERAPARPPRGRLRLRTPPMLEAVRALCERRQSPAQLALESGMACGFGACFGCSTHAAAAATCACASTVRSIDAPSRTTSTRPPRRSAPPHERRVLRAPSRHPSSRLGHVRPARRRRAPSATSCAALPSPRPTRGPSPPARAGNPRRGVGGPGRADQLDRAPQQGPRWLHRRGTARGLLEPAGGPRCR